MTSTDLHQRMLHQLDRVKALNVSPPDRPAPGLEQEPHVSHIADTTVEPPHVPAMTDSQPEVEPQATSGGREQRGEPRHKVNKKGLIVYVGDELGVECEIRDLSATGAKLRLDNDITVPSCFDLIILPENITKKVQVCWRDDRDLGIQFLEDD